MLPRVGSGIERGFSHVQGVLPTVYNNKKLKEVSKTQQRGLELVVVVVVVMVVVMVVVK
jgi:hypothetical protein